MKDCSHPDTEIRRMSHCNQIKLQCMGCGQSVGPAIKHSAVDPDVLATITEFDYDFRERRQQEITEETREFYAAKHEEWIAESESRKDKYKEYLRTPEWRQKRSLVIHREKGLCQGCGLREIDEVHHLTYANVFDELLYQLVGLCEQCHRKAHSK